jgi:hypothetical protein
MKAAPTAEQPIFAGGPPTRFQTWVGLIKPSQPHLVHRALIAITIMWVPLAVLTGIRGDLVGADARNSFLFDFGAQARFLIVPPLLIYAESYCLPKLSLLASQFMGAGLVGVSDYPRYRAAVSSTIRLLNSTSVELIAVLLSFVLVAALFWIQPLSELPGWHGLLSPAGFAPSPAGVWGALVSLPLLVLLELGWVWRLTLWTRFLWLMSRLDLRLVAAHPDHAAGVRFVEVSLRAFLPLGFVIGVVVAGPVLNQVVHEGVAPSQFRFLVAGTASVAVCAFVGPLLVFIGKLIAEQRRGMFAYGALARWLGEQFERKWLKSEAVLGENALSVSDFSATTDLYSIVANVYAMRIVPLQLRNLILLIVVTLLPFLPIALLSVPLDLILQKLAGLFL